MPADISGRRTVKMDVREAFGNLIYTNMNGIAAHALALKIYRSEGDLEYTDAEVQALRTASEKLCTPMFIDGLALQINKSDKSKGE